MRVLLLLILCCSSSWAKVQEHVIQGKTISIDVPAEWETVKELYGMPLSALGPEENGLRPAMSFSFTGMTKKIMTVEKFQSLFKDFKQTKTKWVNKYKGKLLMFEEMTPVTFSKDIQGHFIGAEFIVDDITFAERSYYLYCKDEVYHVKWLIRDEQRKHMKDIEQILRSFSCK
jgi:hypothetical protein